jgi:hypothetical protein
VVLVVPQVLQGQMVERHHFDLHQQQLQQMVATAGLDLQAHTNKRTYLVTEARTPVFPVA